MRSHAVSGWGTCIGFTSFTPIDLRIALQKNYSEDGLMEMVDGKVPAHLPTHLPAVAAALVVAVPRNREPRYP